MSCPQQQRHWGGWKEETFLSRRGRVAAPWQLPAPQSCQLLRKELAVIAAKCQLCGTLTSHLPQR